MPREMFFKGKSTSRANGRDWTDYPAWTPVPHYGPAGVDVVTVGFGALNVLAKETGEARAAGNGSNGALKFGTQNAGFEPDKPDAVTFIGPYSQAAGGDGHITVVRRDATWDAWGGNDGPGDAPPQAGPTGGPRTDTNGTLFPYTIVGLAEPILNVVQVAAGFRNSFARTAAGVVWGVGANDLGQLGCGDTAAKVHPMNGFENMAWPQKVLLPLPAIDIASGHRANYAMAILSDKTVALWGNGAATPAVIPGLADVRKAAAGKSISAFTVGANDRLHIMAGGGLMPLSYYNVRKLVCTDSLVYFLDFAGTLRSIDAGAVVTSEATGVADVWAGAEFALYAAV